MDMEKNPSGSATLRPDGLRVAGHPKAGRAKGVSRSSIGAQGDCNHVWYVYFLELSNGDIYVGSTDDLRRRVASHQQGHVISTSKYLPLILRSYVAVGDEATARSLERYFKSGSGKAFAKKRFLAASE
jgi:putative endonuclease